MDSSFRHIALVVSNLKEAEEYYRTMFGLEILGRETMLNDGQWYQLPLDKEWEDFDAAGTEIMMLALRKGDVVIALFSGPELQGQVFSIGLTMSEADIAEVRAQLPPDITILIDHRSRLHFIDSYRILWQLELPGREFTMSGVAEDRWLEL